MSIISGLTNNQANYTNTSANEDASTKKTTTKTTTATSTQDLDSYIRSEATSLADYLGKNTSDKSSGLYSVLTYGQQGKLDLICNKVQGENGTTSQTVTLADYLANDASDNADSLYNSLQSTILPTVKVSKG